MDVGIYASGGQDLAFAGQDLGRGPDLHRHPVHHVRVPSLADACDASVPHPDVRLEDAGVIEDEGVGNDEVHRALRAGRGPLRHALPHGLTASEGRLLPGERQVLLHLHDEVRIRKPHPVSSRRPEHTAVTPPRKPAQETDPLSRALNSAASFVSGSSSAPSTSPFMP